MTYAQEMKTVTLIATVLYLIATMFFVMWDQLLEFIGIQRWMIIVIMGTYFSLGVTCAKWFK